MHFIRETFFNFASNYFPKTKAHQEPRQKISRCQSYFEKIYQILSWENTSYTLTTFLVLNYFFWLMVQLEIKILGLLFCLCLIFFIWDSFFTDKEEFYSTNKYSDSFNDIKVVIYDTVLNLRTFRKDNPSTFCVSMSLVFFAIRFIARTVSGYEILYFILLLIFFVPLLFKLLPEETAENYKNNIISLFTVSGILAEEELIPFIRDKDFSDRDNDLDSLLTDRTADSVSTSLISGLTTMPSHLDIGETPSDVQEEDLLPNRNITCDLSSDSDSEHREMSFASSHFSRDSSSEDERLLEKDVQFNDTFDENESVSNSGLPGALMVNIAAMGNRLVGNIFQNLGYKQEVKRQNSSSSSDFEFVDSEDIN